TCVIKLIVIDPKPDGEYSLKCPPDMKLACADEDGRVVVYEVDALRGCTPVPVECHPPSGNLFPVGTTKVECLLDRPGLSPLECSFNVAVDCRRLRQIRINLSLVDPKNPALVLDWDDDNPSVTVEVADSILGPWAPITGARPGVVIKIAQEKG